MGVIGSDQKSSALVLVCALVSLCFLLPNGSLAAGKAAAEIDSMDAIAEDFVNVGLRFQNHDPLPFIFLGPPAWREAARADASGLDVIIAQLNSLQSRLAALPLTASGEAERRRRDLLARVVALTTRGQILLGDFPASFNQETEQLFGVVAPTYSESHFRALVAELDSLIPGEGDLPSRVAAFRDQFVIPPDKLESVIGRAMAECRARTLAYVELPAHENVILNITQSMPWVGFTEYQGDGRSIVHLNSDVPVHIERAIELGCHEGYPGHHVHATLLEQEIVKRRGWIEYAYIPLGGPLAVIAEGAASFAMNMAFTRDERLAFERDVLLPLAGLESTQLEIYYHYIDLVEALNFARNEAARKHLYQGLSRDEAERWLMMFGLETAGTAATRLNVIEAQRSYVVTYNHGREIVAGYLSSRSTPGSADSWKDFVAILTTPLSPADLVAASPDSGVKPP